MTDWKEGDTVTFALTGTIESIHEMGYTIYAFGVSIPVLKFAVLGTPEQAKRERIIAQLSKEFTDVSFETRPHAEHGPIIVMIAHVKLKTEQIEQIRSRIEELEAQQ